jgi:hypothetical protein
VETQNPDGPASAHSLRPALNPPRTPAPRRIGAPCSATPKRSRPAFFRAVRRLGGLEHVGTGDPVAYEEPKDRWRVDRPKAAEEPATKDDTVEGGAGGGEHGKLAAPSRRRNMSARLLFGRIGCATGPWAAAWIAGSEDLVAGRQRLHT